MASQSYHNTHSNTYDRMASNSTLSIARHIVHDISPPITPDSYILDNACGTGLVTSLIKTKYPFAHIKGADLAPRMIDVFKARAVENQWENIESDVLDVRDLKTLEDGTFTHVITNFGFTPNVDDPSGPLKAAREMWRVLRSGGVAAVTVWSERNFTDALVAAARVIRPNEEPFNWHIPEEWSRGSWLMQQLEDAGFGNQVSVNCVEGRAEAESLDELVGNMMLGKDLFYKGYDEEEIARLPEVLKEEVRKLKAYNETDVDVGIKMKAWVGFAWK